MVWMAFRVCSLGRLVPGAVLLDFKEGSLSWGQSPSIVPRSSCKAVSSVSALLAAEMCGLLSA